MKNQAKTLIWRTLCALSAAFVLSGCASRSPAPVVEHGSQPVAVAETASSLKDLYTVKKGDTLRSIAQAHNLDYRDLIVWNSIENPNRIQPGVTLRVRPPGSSGAQAEVAVTRPISVAPLVENRSLDGGSAPSPGASVVSPAGGNTSTLKREPKGGKEGYSDAALAQAQGQGQGQPRVAEPMPASVNKPEVAAPATPAPTHPPAAPPAASVSEEDVSWLWPSNGKIIGTFSEGGSKGIDIAGKAGDPVLAAGEGKVVYSGTGLRGYGKLVIVKHNNTFLSAYAHNQNVLVKEGQSVAKGQKIAEMGNTDADQVKLHFEVRRQGKPVDPLKYLPSR
jgi:lipoprotein NlpD